MDVAAEQGSLQMIIAKKFADEKINLITNKNYTAIECHLYCHRPRSAWHMQYCVQQWYNRNDMPHGGGINITLTHPHMKILPGPKHHNSPENGWSFTKYPKSTDLLPNEKPLTYHPCKNMMYATPEYVRKHWRECK
jgi:hypothetical protein